mgnify:CR=1 FL=1
MKNDQNIKVFSISNEHIRLEAISLGAAITKLFVKNRDGQWTDVVLGYETPEEYLDHNGCLGATIGRVAGRIKGASFELNGKTYELYAN